MHLRKDQRWFHSLLTAGSRSQQFSSQRWYASHFHHANPLIPLEEYSQRRQSLLQLIFQVSSQQSLPKRHVILLPAAQVKYQAFHVPYVFRQDSTFRYFTGLPEPNALLVLAFTAVDNKQVGEMEEILFVETRDEQKMQWEGPSLGVSGAKEWCAMKDVRSVDHLQDFLRTLFTSSPSHEALTLWLPNEASTENSAYRNLIQDSFTAANPPKTLRTVNVSPFVDRIRVVKSAGEIASMERASTHIHQALRQTMHRTKTNSTTPLHEAHIWNCLEHEVRASDSSPGATLAYPPVIAGGDRATIIHYLHNNQLVAPDHMVLVDAGVDWHGYVSDVTRTWPVTGRFTSAQRVLYEIVVEVQQQCISLVSPDHSLDSVHRHMLLSLAKLLRREHILTSTTPSSADLEVAQLLCPHHVGHYLGLDVHDCPSMTTSRPLQQNMAFTLEPGLYIPRHEDTSRSAHHADLLRQVHEEFHGTGIRVEDDFVLDKSGQARVLGGAVLCPKTVKEIEDVMASRDETFETANTV